MDADLSVWRAFHGGAEFGEFLICRRAFASLECSVDRALFFSIL
jgi:hypothetical protein